MTTFLDGVNRVLRTNTIIQGDDDDITSFADTQHRATLNLAKIAIQTTLNELISDRLIPYEETDGTLTYVASQRLYTLPADFVRFSGKNPLMVVLENSVATNSFIYEYPGGEESIRRELLQYREQEGNPLYFYSSASSVKKVGLYPVPDSSGTELRYVYEKDVSVTNESDVLPFHTTSESYAFLDMASRYFQFLFTKQPLEGLENDIIYRRGKTALMQLMKASYPSNKYGYTYA